MIRFEAQPMCFGDGGMDKECSACGCRVKCINRKMGWGAGILMTDLEHFLVLEEKLTKGFSQKEEEVLQEMVDCGAYMASDYSYCVLGRGIVPDEKQLEAEKMMEVKMRAELARLENEYPRVALVYHALCRAIEPDSRLN